MIEARGGGERLTLRTAPDLPQGATREATQNALTHSSDLTVVVETYVYIKYNRISSTTGSNTTTGHGRHRKTDSNHPPRVAVRTCTHTHTQRDTHNTAHHTTPQSTARNSEWSRRPKKVDTKYLKLLEVDVFCARHFLSPEKLKKEPSTWSFLGTVSPI